MVCSDDDGDDDGIVNVCDDDLKRHQKNNDAVMTIFRHR